MTIITVQNSISTVLATAQHNLEKTARRLKLDLYILEKLASPKEKIELRLSPKLGDDHIANLSAFIVRHNDTLGPAKGGIRMTSSVTMNEVVGLAMEMTWKTALIGVPFGGGKSGICCDAASLSPIDKEIIIRSFARHARRHFGPELYVPAPDMGTNEADMGHIRDCISYSDGVSITRGCFVTGKPIILGGIPGRREATGKGVVFTIEAACKEIGREIKTLTVAVQGFGNVGQVAAVEMFRRGAKVVAVSDITGAVYHPDGLDIDRLAAHVSETGGVKDFYQGKGLSGPDLFGVPCDCLIPAAAGSQITIENVNQIKAALIAEGANAPIRPKANRDQRQ